MVNQLSQSTQPITEPDDALKHPTGNNRGLHQAYILRDLAAEQAMLLRDAPFAVDETKQSRAQAICALVKAWDTASQQVRIIRGRPLPGSLRPESKPKKAKLKHLPPPTDTPS